MATRKKAEPKLDRNKIMICPSCYQMVTTVKVRCDNPACRKADVCFEGLEARVEKKWQEAGAIAGEPPEIGEEEYEGTGN